MSKGFGFPPEARRDFRESALWYRERSPQAAADFRVTVSHSVLAIAESTLRYPGYLYGTRRCLLPTFPFSIVYIDDPDSIKIIAVAHHKRRPGYWKSRL
jgi:plasmid stabilization system protein ParE